MRIAWFSPLPPVRSGIAAYSAELLPFLARDFAIDCFVDSGTSTTAFDAHDFIWRHQRDPYDLIVYQMGNAPCHDYMWGYLAPYPGLVVLHDARLHQARARCLLSRDRPDDYRAEFRFDHPEAVQDVAEYAVEGLGGPIYYFWSMLRVVMMTARTVACHNERVAAALREEYPGVPIDTIRMGVPENSGGPTMHPVLAPKRALGIPENAVVFVAFGKMTAEKRIDPIARAFRQLLTEGVDAYLLLVGDASDDIRFAEETVDQRVRVTGYVADRDIGAYLAAADVCLCLRWPTALETSASWLRCLAAGKATVISDLEHLADVPALDPRSWTPLRPDRRPVAVAIDLLDEQNSLLLAMRRLAADRSLRDDLARAGREYWSHEHRLEMMADDYRRLLRAAAERPAPTPAGLPPHFSDDYSQTARDIARHFDATIDILPTSPTPRRGGPAPS